MLIKIIIKAIIIMIIIIIIIIYVRRAMNETYYPVTSLGI